MAQQQLSQRHQDALKAAGVDPANLPNLNWAQLLQLVMAILSQFINKQESAIKASATGGQGCSLDEHCEHLRAIEDLHAQLADCAQECLNGIDQCCKSQQGGGNVQAGQSGPTGQGGSAGQSKQKP